MAQIHPDDRSRYQESYRWEIENGPHAVEYRIVRKDGEIRYIKEVGIVTHSDDGERTEAVGWIQDVTEQAEMAKEIEANTAKLKLAARTAQLGYWLVDEVGFQPGQI
jgi:PAS domain S-box-containing protein